jgi:hypothetical protein
MYFEDNFNPTEPNDYNQTYSTNLTSKGVISETKHLDIGYNIVNRNALRVDGRIKNVKIEMYSSSGTGNSIRDAETGVYYKYLVGSKDEHLFFKVALATGECYSKNGSSTFFYISPTHYMSHMKCDVSPEIIRIWEEKRNARLNELNSEKKSFVSNTIIN